MAYVSCKASKGDLCFLRETRTQTTIQGETTTHEEVTPGIVRSVASDGRVLSFETANGTLRRAPKGGAFGNLAVCRQTLLNESSEQILKDVPQGSSFEEMRKYMLQYRRTEAEIRPATTSLNVPQTLEA